MKASIHFMDRCVAGLIISALLLLTGCDQTNTGLNENENSLSLEQIIRSQSNLSIFESLLVDENFNSSLNGEQKVTIFTPSDEAFNKLPAGYLASLTDQQKQDMIKYHAINRNYPVDNENKDDSFTTLQGGLIRIINSQELGTLINNRARVITKNITAKNGIIHIIDDVLIPYTNPQPFNPNGTLFDNISEFTGYEKFTTHLAAAGLKDFLESQGTKTLLGTHDDYLDYYESMYGQSFSDADWKEIMQYHVLNLDITTLPLGSVHILPTLSGEVLYLYADMPNTFIINNPGSGVGFDPVYVVKSANGHIVVGPTYLMPDKFITVLGVMRKRVFLDNKFYEALENSEIKDRLNNDAENFDEKFTIFMPSDDALNSIDLTSNLLKYHVIRDAYTAEQLQHNKTYSTLQGQAIEITKNGEQILINGSAVITKTNLIGKNGVVHIIDRVLTPVLPTAPAGTLFDKISNMADYKIFAGRLVTAGLNEFLQTPGNKTLLPSSDDYLEAYERNNGRTFTDDEWKSILQYHLLDQDITSYPVGSHNTLETLSGDSLYLYISPNCYVFNMNGFGECGWGAPEFVIESTNGHIVSGMGMWLPDRFTDIISIISKRPYLRTFTQEMTSEVVNRLINGMGNDDKKFTVFVPGDHATGMNSLPANEHDLTQLFKYHILLDSFTSEQLQHDKAYKTWQGQSLEITKNGDQILVNGSAVITQTNLIGKNGVVHIIDRVLTPPAD